MSLVEKPFLTQIDLRLNPRHWPVFDEAGIAMPPRPNSWVAGDISTYWLGPDEVLFVADQVRSGPLQPQIEEALGETWGTVVDVSDQRTVLSLSGVAARELLAGGCAVDLHRRSFGPGECAQTLLGKAPVILALVDQVPTFDVFVRSSFAGYLADWLVDAIEHIQLVPGWDS